MLALLLLGPSAVGAAAQASAGGRSRVLVSAGDDDNGGTGRTAGRQGHQSPLQDFTARKAHAVVERIAKECLALPPRRTPPTSVHDLRIDDVRVVAGMGDSISAGFGAKGLSDPTTPTPIKATTESRGVAFSMGGDPGALTLANLVSVFRPDLVGRSIGDHVAEVCYYLWCLPFQYWPRQDRLNGAQSGATVPTLPHELDYVVDQMRRDPGIDFDRDFKLLTLFIGSNDVCIGCSTLGLDGALSPDVFESHMRQLFESMRQSIPRLVVNVLLQFNVSQVWDATHDDLRCSMLRSSGLVFECTCAFMPGPLGAVTRARMDELVQAYNERIVRIAAEYRSLRDPSFAVTVDPLFRNVKIREWGLPFLSDVDCFHPSLSAHESMAVGIWNNMFLPWGRKVEVFDPNTDPVPVCPDEHSRIQTE
ncbi:hypothetical protein HK105_208937 [Polyrhizophydium stewartii]|uniref:Phospholipase B1, membrane-associated n=1 Tax=Polyrhizophydium stewartii TaxID=2732419 RepID=A0ABR4MWH8_9FUNG|nr:hypothetical protein HK105_006759 [Polyrhizophydium stewartii]